MEEVENRGRRKRRGGGEWGKDEGEEESSRDYNGSKKERGM